MGSARGSETEGTATMLTPRARSSGSTGASTTTTWQDAAGGAAGLRAALTADNPPSAAGLGVDMGDGKGRTLVAGEWNSAIYWPLLAEAQAAGDSACSKNRMSGLWSASQPLWRHLEAASKKTLLFAGVNTDQCVLGTLADAYNAGWDCLLVDDCCATTTPGAGKCVCTTSGGPLLRTVSPLPLALSA